MVGNSAPGPAQKLLFLEQPSFEIPPFDCLSFDILSLVLGACLGSFLNLCITRLPVGESVLVPASHCRSCNRPIPLRALVPLAGYLLLRARCGQCGVRIPPRYFLVELCTAALTLAWTRRFGLGLSLVVRLTFAGALLAAAVIDFETGLIPDVISAWGTVCALALSWCAPALSIQHWPSPLGSLLGLLSGAGLLLGTARGYRAVTGRDGVGGGDIKLLAMIGAFAGWEAVPAILFSSALAGTLWGVGLMVFREEVSLTTPLPFAPFLCMGALFHLSRAG